MTRQTNKKEALFKKRFNNLPKIFTELVNT